MKGIKIFSVLLLLISTVTFVGYKVYSKVIMDTEPPVLTCESNELIVTTEVTEEELIQNVKAVDNRSGDVSDTIVIESMSAFSEDGTRVVRYAAIDESKNVGRCEQTITYEGYKAPEFDMSSPLCFPVGSRVDILGAMSAESVLDGDLTDKIKYSLHDTINTMMAGSYPIEFRVMDSGGKTVYLETQVEIYDVEYAGIYVELSDYLVYVDKGEKFNAKDYYKGADEDGTLSIRSNVNTNEVGTYYVDYVVKGAGMNGKTRLVVVVQ